jgi:hypothetical protein
LTSDEPQRFLSAQKVISSIGAVSSGYDNEAADAAIEPDLKPDPMCLTITNDFIARKKSLG